MRDWLAEAAELNPERLAVEADDGCVTYAQLDARAGDLAARLDVAEGEAMTIPARPCLDFAALLHALPRRAAALEPLPASDPAAPPPALSASSEPVRLRSDHPPEALHTIIRTSGTTGRPKRVELTHRNQAASAVASADALRVEPHDRWLCPLPLHHVGGLNVLVRCAIHRTTAVLHERFDADRVRATLEAGEVTLASMVPTMLVRLREAGLTRAPGLRAIVLGGGPIPPGLLEWAAAADIPVTPVYGMTETCSQVVADTPGRALEGVELRLAGDAEILIRGPMVARGELAEDGWLHTGDLGRLDEQGLLHVEGRKKELIVTGGENVAPLEVERVLAAHPAVADAGVAAVADAEWGEAITAWVVLTEPAPAEELRAWCRDRLAAFKVPKAFHAVSELPRNATGKLMRERLHHLDD